MSHIVEREWGYWQVLDILEGVKVKKLVIYPGQSLSMQKHFHRAEHWYVLKGVCKLDLARDNDPDVTTVTLSSHQTQIIDREMWHRAYNETDTHCHILEVQYGDKCIEEDIERA